MRSPNPHASHRLPRISGASSLERGLDALLCEEDADQENGNVDDECDVGAHVRHFVALLFGVREPGDSGGVISRTLKACAPDAPVLIQPGALTFVSAENSRWELNAQTGPKKPARKGAGVCRRARDASANGS